MTIFKKILDLTKREIILNLDDSEKWIGKYDFDANSIDEIKELKEIKSNFDKFKKNLADFEKNLEESKNKKIKLEEELGLLKENQDFSEFWKLEKRLQELNQKNDPNNKLRKEKNDLNEEIGKLNNCIDYKEFQYKIEHNTQKIEKISDNISETKNEMSKLNYYKRLENLQKSLCEVSGKKIKLK